MRRLRNRDGKAIARVDFQHHVNVGASISRVNDVVGTHYMLYQQLLQHCYFAITRSGADDGIDLAGSFVEELGAENMILWDDPFQRGINHLDGRGRENVEIE